MSADQLIVCRQQLTINMSLRKDALLRNMGPGLPPRTPGLLLRQPGGGRGPKDFSPLSWQEYFDECETIEVPEIDSQFCVYKAGFHDDDAFPHKPLLLLIHGGGYSGLTWSTFVKNLRQFVYVKVAAVDVRGHGQTKTNDDSDLSIETLSRDIGYILRNLVTDEDMRVVLMGHSMGGAIAVRSSTLCRELNQCLAGLIVIDVVEGTALEALQGMQTFLRGRPKDFATLDKAIEWCVRSGQTKNIESARVSMPSQLKAITGTSLNPSHSSSVTFGISDIPEDGEDTSTTSPEDCKIAAPSTKYEFRVDLPKSEVYWRGWFEGLSQQFLDSRSPAKLLLLAGVDRLDKTLTVGQMQGKFQMQVLPQCGHAVHEDVPDKVAEVVSSFLVRNQLTSAKSNDFHPILPGC